jgi:hypothetical protein
VYSYYFALNALGMIGGPMLYMRISKKYKRKIDDLRLFCCSLFERSIDLLPGRSQTMAFLQFYCCQLLLVQVVCAPLAPI